MAKISTLEVTVVVIAIVLVAVAGYYIAVRSSPIDIGSNSTTVTGIPTTVSETSTSTSSSTTSTSMTTTSTTTSTSIPSGAVMLPFDSSNKTVFLNLVALSTGNPFNFNGTSDGQLHIYIPAGWTVIATFVNQQGLTHNLLIVQNTTATPGDDVGQDGTIELYVGATSSTYLDNGINGGASASGSVVLSPGIYWFCCGIEGHAAAGMWGVVVVSSSVTTPYYTTS
jgi:sulfocyanin